MQSNVLKNEMAVIRELKVQPFITLLLPFEPKMTPKYILEKRIKSTLEKIKNELFEHYSFVSAKEVNDKLVSIISNLDYNTHKKSVAVLVSSEECKTFYMDVNVEEKFFVTTSFQYRQLVGHQKDDKEYLLVVMNDDYAAVYRGQGETISKILHNVPEYKRQGTLLDKSHSKDAGIKDQQTSYYNFIRLIDKSLSILLNAFPLPVFLLAPTKIAENFGQLTHNNDFIVATIEENFYNISEDEIEKFIQPFISHWQILKDRFWLHQLGSALENGTLEVGIEDVWSLAKRKNIKMLVVEEDYEYKAFLGKDLIISAEEAANNIYIKDAVEDVIEKVLADGGKVTFVSGAALHNFMHIAAIKSY
ncbi:hypothetical protein OCK74_20740 [Chitinophagaceae bacterium LB-8]|uniref:Uncharacterized protein n=1 Tax=Paraflavisolibacter caeni TaxID=2982496 RepID=A0A9X2XY49_9BACT|nr:hypothetical protein [Paraflavisolibacter caeni]MCU7551561.1 hypothetical protein [Paraflavisolibacter caeni]